MTSIIITKNLALNLLPQERELAIAFQGNQIQNINKPDLEIALIKIIENTHSILNWQYDALIGVKDARAMARAVKTYFPKFTLEEMWICFSRGAHGFYGEFKGLSEVTYSNWLRSYAVDPLRMEAKRKQNDFVLERDRPRELTKMEKDKIMIDGITEAFEIIKSGKEYTFPMAHQYDWLDKRKKLPFTRERKMEFMLLSRIQVKAKKELELSLETDTRQRRVIKAAIEQMERSNTAEMIVEAKRIALITLFKDLASIEADITELFQ